MRKQNAVCLAIVAAGLLMAGWALAGSLDPTNAPGPTMHTLEEIYQKVQNLAPQTLQTLSSNTAVVNAGYYASTNLTQADADLVAGNIVTGIGIFGVTGTVITATGNATESQVLGGSTFSAAGASGLTGTMTDRGAVAITPGTAPQTIAQGYHNGSGSVSGDANLVTGNIKSGATIFGVAGKSSVVETATGTAVAGDMLASKTAYVNGALITGTMASQTLSAASATVTAGYYASTNLTQADADLVAGNIATGIGIFGVTGTAITATGNATESQVLGGSTFSAAGASGLTGTMTDRGAVAITPGTAPQTIAQGYHNGSGSVSGDANLVAGNIKSGTTIFGVVGMLSTNTGSGGAYSAAVPKTGQTASYQTGDDGDYEKGVAWPNPRFTVQSDANCVLDNLTGLVWARNASIGGRMTWSDAITYCEGLNYGGQTDWRMPNVKELFSLIDIKRVWPALPTGHPFAGVQSSEYWSSSTSVEGVGYVWYLTMAGTVNFCSETFTLYVWPVRGGQ